MSGDEIRIYYDGTIEEGNPQKIHTVYAFNQVSPSKIQWCKNLILFKKQFSEGESPADIECNAIYHFELLYGEYANHFSYYIYDEKTAYLLFYEEWYLLEELVLPFDGAD